MLRIKLCFYDVWKPQLRNIEDFLESKGAVTNHLAAQNRPPTLVWYLTLSNSAQINKVIRKMLPFASKKRGDLMVALEYLDDQITADEAILKLNQFVRDKRRSGYIRSVNIPHKRTEGALEGRRFGAAAGARTRLVEVPEYSQEAIRRDRAEKGISLRELQLRYGYSERVIRRILKS